MNKCLFEHLFIFMAFFDRDFFMLRVSRLCLLVAFSMPLAVISTAANSAVSSSRASFSASRSSPVSRPVAANSLSRTQTASSFKSTSFRSITKVPPKPVNNKVTVKKPLYSSRKSSHQNKPKYEYYAFNDCVPYSAVQMNGWRCIDRD
jgi:DNA ligase-1